jgi:hypothetical protein
MIELGEYRNMAIGLSLHVGLNHPNPTLYPSGWQDLGSAEQTATSIRDLADSCGFWTKCLLTKVATANRVLAGIELAASMLSRGDIFFLTYAGHGSQIPDISGDEDDGFDETWVAYDRMIVDDELFWLWGRFQPGVRILIVSDSCHSGTISSVPAPSLDLRSKDSDKEIPALLSKEIALNLYLNNKNRYDSYQKRAVGVTVGCTVLSFSACQDGEITTFDPNKGGLFTNRLLDVWNEGGFQGNYQEFFQAISRVFQTEDRNPNYRVIGAPSYSFEDQRPFTI